MQASDHDTTFFDKERDRLAGEIASVRIHVTAYPSNPHNALADREMNRTGLWAPKATCRKEDVTNTPIAS